ncbi:hypothetical protein KEM56_005203 [Ascosphaera pollenicola]|nr:hypothetical protein KEM56_005203 [Ascosphaera pollenicola]
MRGLAGGTNPILDRNGARSTGDTVARVSPEVNSEYSTYNQTIPYHVASSNALDAERCMIAMLIAYAMNRVWLSSFRLSSRQFSTTSIKQPHFFTPRPTVTWRFVHNASKAKDDPAKNIHPSAMKIAVFSCHDYEKAVFQKWNKKFGFEIDYLPEIFNRDTAGVSKPYDAICTFVNDIMDAEALEILNKQDTRLIVLRCAGYDTVDLKAADEKGIIVMRVPAYSPNAIAEFTVGSVMSLNRHIPEAASRIAAGNLDVNGLVGFDFHAKTVGVVGTGRIGKVVARTFGLGFHCNMLLHDIVQSKEMTDLGFKYVSLDELLEKSDVISFHCPATKATQHLVNKDSIAKMKDGVLLVNTSRGSVIDTTALLDAIDSGKVKGAALDVYEGEVAQFYRTKAERKKKDPTLERIISNPRVLLTGHLGYFTIEALNSIAEVTLTNVANFQKGDLSANIAIEKYE